MKPKATGTYETGQRKTEVESLVKVQDEATCKSINGYGAISS